MSLMVNEIFFSIQGESSFVGLPCAFIRLAGCNLRCNYCDTRYAYDQGVKMSIQDIVSALPAEQHGLVEVTGGEPLLQDSCPELVDRLLQDGNTVLVETNGSRDIRCLPEGSICILDIKCPLSGMSDRMDFGNLDRLRPQDELKFVIQGRSDYLWAREIIEKHSRPPPEKVLFSPAHGLLEPRELAEWTLADRLQVRIQLPIHRFLWPGEERGR
jgi:7-carboxy-7-deazaguanine synthase